MHVFTYGSLMFEPVWSRVVTRPYVAMDAQVCGYQRRRVKGEAYPALIPGEAADRVCGLLYLDVHQEDLQRLDLFEGAQYRRQKLLIETQQGAREGAVYVFRPEYMRLVSPRCWEPDWFAQQGIHRFLNRYRGFL